MLKKAHVRYLLIKFILFTGLAIFVLCTKERQVAYLKPFIGALMVLYGADGILFEIFEHRKHFLYANKTYLGLIELIFGIVLIASPMKFEYVCIIWATWSIIRESYEIKEIVADMEMLIPRILSGVESVVVIVFSILLILEPGEHHALIHLSLLSAELILNPSVVLVDEFLTNWKEKKKEKTE